MPSDLVKLARAANGKCHYCGEQMDWKTHSARQATIDHKVPRSRGGGTHIENKVAACWRCNTLKSDMTDEEFRARWPDPSDIPPAFPNWRAQRRKAAKRSAKRRRERRRARQRDAERLAAMQSAFDSATMG